MRPTQSKSFIWFCRRLRTLPHLPFGQRRLACRGDESALGIVVVDALRFLALNLALLHFALGHFAQHGNNLALISSRLERAAAHLNPGEIAVRLRVAVATDSEFDRTVFAKHGRIGERGEISRPVENVNTIEQSMADKLTLGDAEQLFACGRHKQHYAVPPMSSDDVGHTARKQAIASLLGIEQTGAGAQELFGNERKA